MAHQREARQTVSGVAADYHYLMSLYTGPELCAVHILGDDNVRDPLTVNVPKP